MKRWKIVTGILCVSGCLMACGADGNPVSENVIQQEVVETTEVEIQEMTQTEQNVVEDTMIEEKDNMEEADEEVAKGELIITFIGHASMKIETSDGTVIYIDPNYAGDYSKEADYILVTHGHGDHLPRPEVVLKEGGKSIYYTEALHDGIYETYDFGNIKIEAVAAGGNPNHDINVCVGYLVTADGYTIYHAGDTSKIDQMAKLAEREIDYAFYPIDGVYNMDATEATEAAELVKAKHSIPIHALDDNHTGKADAFIPEGRMTIEAGESICLPAK